METNCDIVSVLVYLQIFGGDGLAPCLAGRGKKQKFHFDAAACLNREIIFAAIIILESSNECLLIDF